MNYSFRIRISMPPSARFEIEEPELNLTVPSVGELRLQAIGGVPLSEAATVVLSRGGFKTAEQAADAAARVRSCLQVALARVRIGADFGDRRPDGGGISSEVREQFERERGVRVLNEVHGTMVFESDPPPMFASGQAVGLRLITSIDRFRAAVDAADSQMRDRAPACEVAYEVAYDLFAASFFVAENADARFLLLTMAIETLLHPERRPPVILAHVESMISATERMGLPPDEEHQRASLLGSLRYLRDESIGQAGRRLAVALGDRTYMDESPEIFFSRCYALRSKLVHGTVPLPERDEVSRRAANLEVFVGHLLSRNILESVPD